MITPSTSRSDNSAGMVGVDDSRDAPATRYAIANVSRYLGRLAVAGAVEHHSSG
jgi:hypothetical protein